ncbi:MAG TPA: tetratricopeptide repeat protein, partial [Longimicrobiales bacterium]|nr:tetratricopeptide repeat protein [Longimicrobiales bacterium]
MKVRKGLLFAASLLFIGTGCASGGGGGTPASGPGPSGPAPASSSAADGERERSDQFTGAAEEYLDDGFAQETIGNQQAADQAFTEALAQARLAVENDPTNPKAHLLLGQAAVENEEWDLAAEAYAEALELRPAYLEERRAEREQMWIQLYNEGAPLINEGDYQTAIAIFGAADAVYSERPEIKILLGQLLAQEQEFDRAIELQEEARAIIESPRIEEVDSATAASWMEEAEDIDPRVAQWMLLSERYVDAIPVLESLVADHPSNLQYVFSLAGAFGQTEQADEAVALYEEVATRSGLSPNDFVRIGLGLYGLDEFLTAADVFSQAIELSRYSRDAYEFGAISLLQIEQQDSVGLDEEELDQLLEFAEGWVRLDPNSTQAHSA